MGRCVCVCVCKLYVCVCVYMCDIQTNLIIDHLSYCF